MNRGGSHEEWIREEEIHLYPAMFPLYCLLPPLPAVVPLLLSQCLELLQARNSLTSAGASSKRGRETSVLMSTGYLNIVFSSSRHLSTKFSLSLSLPQLNSIP